MKRLFPGHYQLNQDELNHLWKNALFIFDTNVLLNLYSYPEEARQALISLLEIIRDRIWIPYHVALEFHRNRFNKIKSSNKAVVNLRDKFSSLSEQLEQDLKKIEFDKRNTGIADIEKRLEALREANAALVEAINAACIRLPGTGLEDPIGAKLAEILAAKVGMPPATQAALNQLLENADERYKRKVPPGYKDSNKNDEYVDNGIIYNGKFGDLIIWKQSIAHIREAQKKEVIFVTGDRKEDWWDEDEGKIRGPRPELIQEFRRESNSDYFWIYTVDAFLQYAKDSLHTGDITNEAIEQVKKVTDAVAYDQANSDAYDKVLRRFSGASTKDFWTSYDFLDGNHQLSQENDYRNLYRTIFSASFLPKKTSDKSPYITIKNNKGVHGVEIVEQKSLKENCVFARAGKAANAILNNEITTYCLIILIDEDSDSTSPDINKISHSLNVVTSSNSVISGIIGREESGKFMVIGRFGAHASDFGHLES